jgi:hypothetical protein
MTFQADIQRMARAAKRLGYPLERVCPNKEPYKAIFIEEYNRFKPRKNT